MGTTSRASGILFQSSLPCLVVIFVRGCRLIALHEFLGGFADAFGQAFGAHDRGVDAPTHDPAFDLFQGA